MKKIILVNLLVLAVLLVAGDVILGQVYRHLAPAQGERNIEILLGEIDPRQALNERPHPYMLWENTPGYTDDHGVRQINAQGYRNAEEVSSAPAPGTLRILALGGSTTYGYLLEQPQDAWPSQLEALLNAQAPVLGYEHVEVVNGGLIYGTSAEVLLHYLFRDRYLGAQMVILHVGENDALPLTWDRYDPEYRDFRPGWGAPTVGFRWGEAWLVKHANIARLFYASLFSDGVALPYIQKQVPPIFNQSDIYYVNNARKNEPVGFERYLDLLLRNIKADGVTPILFPGVLPTPETYRSLGAEARERALYISPAYWGMRVAMHKEMGVMQRLSEKYRIRLIDLPSGSLNATHFLDHLHLTSEGEGIKARFVAERLLAAE